MECYIDFNVYCDGNQQYRMLYATKKEKNETGDFIQRPFLPVRPVNKNTSGKHLFVFLENRRGIET